MNNNQVFTNITENNQMTNEEMELSRAQSKVCGFFEEEYIDETQYSVLLEKRKALGLEAEDECKIILTEVFGSFGHKADLCKAESDADKLLSIVENQMPNRSEIASYAQWLYRISKVRAVLGTIYAYKREYAKASFWIMRAIKTETCPFSLDFVKFFEYVFGKLPALATTKTRVGCGFSPDEAMGPVAKEGVLSALGSRMIVAEMEGENGELIIAKQCNGFVLGLLERLGSTISMQYPHPIDIYETFLIDKNYEVEKIQFYVNGYFQSVKNRVRLAKGFRFQEDPPVDRWYDVVES